MKACPLRRQVHFAWLLVIVFVLSAALPVSGASAAGVDKSGLTPSASRVATQSAAYMPLILFNTLGSPASIEHSVFGPNGTFDGGSFGAGKFRTSYIARWDQPGLVGFPKEAMPTPWLSPNLGWFSQGTIEFWARLLDFPATLPVGDKLMLIDIHDSAGSRFSIYFTNDDGQGHGGLCGTAGKVAAVCSGSARTDPLAPYRFDQLLADPTAWHHFRLVWDSTGVKGLGEDKGQVAVLVDEAPQSGVWTRGDMSTFPTLVDGQIRLLPAVGNLKQGSVAFENLRIWDLELLNDVALPLTCQSVQVAAANNRQQFTYLLRDEKYGLSGIQVQRQDNMIFDPPPTADGWIDGFTVGITETLVITVTQIDPALPDYSTLRVMSVGGSEATCGTQPEAAYHIAASPGRAGVLLAQCAAAHPLRYSLVGGKCWQQTATADVGDDLALAVSSRADNVVRFLTLDYEGTIWRSIDFGGTWTVQPLPRPPTQPPIFHGPAALAASAAAPTKLYAYFDVDVADLFGSLPYTYLYRSDDGGFTWQSCGLPGGGSPNAKISGLIASPLLPNRAYLRFVGRGVSFSSWFKTDDSCLLWKDIMIAGWPVGDELALDAIDSNLLYFYGANDQGYRMVGETRQNWQTAPGCQGYHQFLAHPAKTGVLYLRCGNGLFTSLDAGDHWTHVAATGGQELAQDFGLHRMLWLREDGLYTDDGSATNWRLISRTDQQCAGTAYLPALGKAGR